MRLKMAMSGDRVAALLFLAVVAVYGWGSTKLATALQGDIVGPAFFPRVLTVLGVVLGVLLFVRGASGRSGSQASAGDSDVVALVPAALLLGYALLFQPLGFLLATPLFLLAAFRYLGQPGWVSGACYSLAITAVLFGLFHFALDIRLPLGPLARLF